MTTYLPLTVKCKYGGSQHKVSHSVLSGKQQYEAPWQLVAVADKLEKGLRMKKEPEWSTGTCAPSTLLATART